MVNADGGTPAAAIESGATANPAGSVLRLQAWPDAGEAPVLDAAVMGARILLVDDHAINRKVVQLFLRPFGLTITEAHDGAEALRYLAEQPFDLVLMDVHMPVMGGCEAVKRIRMSGESWAGVPVIALTADAMPGDRQRSLLAGMNDHVAKPIQQQDLLNAMARALASGMASAAA